MVFISARGKSQKRIAMLIPSLSLTDSSGQSNGGGVVDNAYALLPMLFPHFAPAVASPAYNATHYLYDEPRGEVAAAIAAGNTQVRACLA
jgi:hypothetical protein